MDDCFLRAVSQMNQNLLAYLDPGSGSFFIQVLIASFCGVLFAVKIFWQNIKSFFKDLLSSDKDSGAADGEK